MYTLDPESKYNRPKPSVRRTPLYSSLTDVDTASAAALSDEALRSAITGPNGENHSSVVYQQSANSSSPALSTRKPQSSGSSTKRMLLAAFCRMRVTRSAGFTGGSEKSKRQDSPPNPEQSLSEMYHAPINKLARTDHEVDVPAASVFVINTTPSLMPHISEPHDGVPVLQVLDEPVNAQLPSLGLGPPDDKATLRVATRKTSRIMNVSYVTSLEPLREDDAAVEEPLTNTRRLSLVNATIESRPISNIRQTDAVAVQGTPGANDESNLPDEEIYSGTQSCSGSDSSYITSNIFSPGLAPGSVYTDGMSPYYLAQPDTPAVSEFGCDFVETSLVANSETDVTLSNVHGLKDARIVSTANLYDTKYPELEGFQGYSLAETEQTSALTLRKFPSSTLESCGGSPFGKQGSTDLVHSWNDGSEHRITALEELVDDLGYLGELII